jgi:hypothetical protein
MEKSKARNRHTHTVHAITAIVSAPKGSAAHSPSQSLSIILGGGSRELAVRGSVELQQALLAMRWRVLSGHGV